MPKSTKPSVRIDDPFDDPFFCDALLIEGFNLVPVTSRLSVSLSFAGYASLITAMYVQIRLTNHFLEQFVPESVFAYAMWQHLYARVNELQKLMGHDFDVAYDFKMRAVSYTVPALIKSYLDGIREFTSIDGQTFETIPLPDKIYTWPLRSV